MSSDIKRRIHHAGPGGEDARAARRSRGGSSQRCSGPVLRGHEAVGARADGEKRREVEIEHLWPHKGLLVLKFAGVDSMSDAEMLIGAELQVPRAERAELEQGWNYVSDLVGCIVFDHGREIGRLKMCSSAPEKRRS